MPTTLRRLRTEQHVAVGEVIEQGCEVIIGRWVDRAKVEQPTARRVHHDVIVDHLPAFLRRLGRSLATAADDSAAVRREAEEHGDQRWDTGWSVTEVVRDYQILRAVLAEYLEEELGRRLEARESLVLNVAIDDAIAAAVASFADSQTTPGIAAATTRSEAQDLLLNALGVVGHELRNPLAPLANSLEILRVAGTDAALIETTRQMMDRQLRVLGRLVEDLMDLPRLARGKMSLARGRVDLVQLVRHCVEDRRGGLAAAGITLVVDLPAAPVWIDGDEARLTQAFGNVLGNAQKFTDGRGTVSVRVTAPGGRRVTVVVRDTGVGIDAALLPHVFEAYTQADGASARTRGGLGLGLALVKGVVELHDGVVTAASDGPGTGTAVTVELPLAAAAAGGPAPPPAAVPPSVRPRRVLVVEDNADSADSLKMYLELHGHTVAVARSGPDGVRVAAEFRPDAVVCDVGLPGMDGYAVAAELRRLATPPGLIVAVSGHGPRTGADGRPDQVFDYYLLKPADPVRVSRLLSAGVSSH